METSRRKFLVSTVTAGATLAMSRRVLGANDRIGVAVIGVRGMGKGHTINLCSMPDAQIVALCDVDESIREGTAKEVEKRTNARPQLVEDFRRVLDNPAVNAVVIATPHHWHTPIAIRAMQAGKDVYVEKPAAHVFKEGRVLIQASKRYQRVVQHGTQMRSSPVALEAEKVLKSGLLGEIKTTKAWNVQKHSPKPPVPDSPVPAGVNYDLWLGPARKRPFNEHRFHSYWQWLREYGNGDIGNDGVHDVDMARFGLGVKTHPIRITSHGSTIALKGEREFPDNMLVAYQYAEGKVLIYEDRGWSPYHPHGVDSGNAFYGTEGWMLFSRRGFFQVFLGEKEVAGPSMGKTGRVGQPAPSHMQNFLECVRSRQQTHADAEVAHLTCGLVHLGEIGFRLGRVLNFDPHQEKILNDPEADAMLNKEYREPWGMPDIS